MSRTVQAHFRLKVIDLSVFFFIFLLGVDSMENGKKLLKVFFSRSENKEDVAAFSINPCIMVLSAGELPTVWFSIERLDSSKISFLLRV